MTLAGVPEQYRAAFVKAIEAFNAQQFFECHEIIEDELWRPMPPGPDKTFLQGWLQVAVSFLHWQRGNQTGANNLLEAGLDKLRATQHTSPFAQAINTAQLIAKSEALYQEAHTTAPLPAYPAARMPMIHSL